MTNLYSQHDSFHLDYGFGGLGSNQFEKFYPNVDINGQTFAYTVKKKTGKYSISTGKFGTYTYADTVWTMDIITYKVKMRTTSIDSIVALVKHLKDTTIHEFNPCILSGGIHFLTLFIGTDTIKYELTNTFDRTALKIVDIINIYLPTENKIWATEQDIKDCEDCWTAKRKRWAAQDKKNKK